MAKICGIQKAAAHPIKTDMPAAGFFDGALIGNGSLGVVVCTRPNGIALHIGHNDIWDIRVEELDGEKLSTFDKVWAKLDNGDGTISVKNNQFYKDYYSYSRSAYDKPYPRPFPCGTLYLVWDIKEYELMGHELDISSGLVHIFLTGRDGKKYQTQVFVMEDRDTLYLRCVDEENKPHKIFTEAVLVPEKDDGMPVFTSIAKGDGERAASDEGVMPGISCESAGYTQLLPALGFEGTVREDLDKGFSLKVFGLGEEIKPLEYKAGETCEYALSINEGYYSQLETPKEPEYNFAEAFERSKTAWHEYWQRAAIDIDDEFLEHMWYTNLYFSKCSMGARSSCPGLFGNFMHGKIGTAWHGDYHMNYNTQQPFWGVFSANRPELHETYIKLVEHLMEVSRAWAQEFYGLPGACFPHSAYPVKMRRMPFPEPDWGWEIFETPWSVQSLWWHYTYTKDKELLRDRFFPLMREATEFMVAFMTRPGGDPVGDGKYHIFPTIVPELYGLTEDLKKNIDGIADVSLTIFLFKAFLEALDELGLTDDPLKEKVEKLLAAMPDYPKGESRFGEVLLSVESEDPDNVVYNVPANLMPLFPAEDERLEEGGELREIAKTSYTAHYNEGGNDIVFLSLQGARLGMLDLEKFKRQVKYCMHPNNTVTDKVMMTGGRYHHGLSFAFMGSMGIWVENFALHSVVTECLIKGHMDTKVLFPNWDMHKAAAFSDIRTKGAFLVSAACADGEVKYVDVKSEAGGTFSIINPWKTALVNDREYTGDVISVDTAAGDVLEIRAK